MNGTHAKSEVLKVKCWVAGLFHGKVHIVYHGTQRCIVDSITQTESEITNEQQAAARVRAGRNRTVALQQMGKRLQGHMPHATEAKLQQTERLRHPTCGDSICLSTTICAREHIVSVRNRCTDNVHAVERSSGSACPCGVVFRATLRRPATAKSSRRFRR